MGLLWEKLEGNLRERRLRKHSKHLKAFLFAEKTQNEPNFITNTKLDFSTHLLI